MELPCTGYSFSSPDKNYISNIGFHPNQLTFQWSSIAPDCSTVDYNIDASNCGSCPNTTNHTIVTCIDVPTNGDVCTFAISVVVCKSNITNLGGVINITLDNHAMTPKTGIL